MSWCFAAWILSHNYGASPSQFTIHSSLYRFLSSQPTCSCLTVVQFEMNNRLNYNNAYITNFSVSFYCNSPVSLNSSVRDPELQLFVPLIDYEFHHFRTIQATYKNLHGSLSIRTICIVLREHPGINFRWFYTFRGLTTESCFWKVHEKFKIKRTCRCWMINESYNNCQSAVLKQWMDVTDVCFIIWMTWYTVMYLSFYLRQQWQR